MPPKMTSTGPPGRASSRLGGRDGVVGRAVLEAQLELAAQQAALGVDVADHHPGDVGVGDADERERAGLVGDDADLDGVAGHVPSSSWRAACRSRNRLQRRPGVWQDARAAPGPIHREYPPSWLHHSASPSSSRRSRSRRTTRSASRSSRSCARACSRPGSARRPAFEQRGLRRRLLGRAAALRRLHRPRARGRDAVRRRDRDPRPDARPRRRQPGRGHARRRRVRDRRALRRGARRRSSGCSRRPRTSGRCTTSRRAARWPTCSWQRLDFGPDVREALAFTFERWNGNGFPAHAGGEAIPLAMRVVHLSHDMEAIGRLFSPERALEAARDRRDRTYDPALADLFVEHGRALVRAARASSSRGTPCSRSSPNRAACSRARRSTRRSMVAADFIDLKSPYMGGHSRRCAQLATGRRARPRAVRRRDRHAAPGGARARLRHDRGLELDLGQARRAHADGVRPGRAPPDADRADAAPLAGPRRPEPGRLGAPREVRRVGLPQARADRHRRSRRRACWPRPRSTSA